MGTGLPDVSVYTLDSITAALFSGQRRERYRYQLLDRDDSVIGMLAGVQEGGSVTYNYLADVKRTCSFALDENPVDKPSDWLSFSALDLSTILRMKLKPYYALQMPDGGWAEWPLGVFLVEGATRSSDGGRVVRQIQGSDLGRALKVNKIVNRKDATYASGTNIVTDVQAALNLVGYIPYDFTPTAKTVPSSGLSWDPGTEYRQVVQDLLASINYQSLFFDAEGVARAGPYFVPSDRDVDFTYTTADPLVSVVAEEATDEYDYFNTPNYWVYTTSQSDKTVITSTFTNTNADSPSSTVSRGITITKVDLGRKEIDQASLNAAVRADAHADSQATETVVFKTPTMPWHGENNIIRLTQTKLGVSDVYSETQWQITLSPGAPMTHSARRTINVG